MIEINDFVKSYDFPENITLDPARAERCYMFGQVEAILTREEAREINFTLGDCPRYKIRVLTRVWDGQVENFEKEMPDGYVYPPVNGTPTWLGGETNGVVKVEA